ncbi:MAG TPA: hypothetical protein VF040_21320 [Ktedonobacterales bacterium]
MQPHEHADQVQTTYYSLPEYQFTKEELARLSELRERVRSHPDVRDCDIAIRRLEFARWRFEHGYISD